jgi:hypothetical protein
LWCNFDDEAVIPEGVHIVSFRYFRSNLFAPRRQPSSVVVPSSVQILGVECFANCSGLSRITFASPSALHLIDRGAFSNCSSLASITIPSSVVTLSDDCFFGCRHLRTVEFLPGSRLIEIGVRAFARCDSLSSISLPVSVQKVDGSAFARSSRCNVKIRKHSAHFRLIGKFGTDLCGELAHFSFGFLEFVQIPVGIRFLSPRCLAGLDLASVVIPRSVDVIGFECFSGCETLCLLEFESPSTLRIIEGRAFRACVRLSSIAIPSSVMTICAECFYDCRALHFVEFEKGSRLSTVEANAFSNCRSLASIWLPDSIAEIDGSVFHGSDLSEIEIDFQNPKLRISGKFIVDSSGTSIVLCFGLLSHLTIPSGIRERSRRSFSRGSSGLKSTFEVQSLDFRPLCCLQLTSIVIPSSVERFGSECFYRCELLSSVTFDVSSRLDTIGERAFYGCSSLCRLTLPASLLTLADESFSHCSRLKWLSFESGSQLKQIGARAFLNCSTLPTVCLPPLVCRLSADSFCGCSHLEEVGCDCESVTQIEPSVFSDCPLLRSVALPASAEIATSEDGLASG